MAGSRTTPVGTSGTGAGAPVAGAGTPGTGTAASAAAAAAAAAPSPAPAAGASPTGGPAPAKRSGAAAAGAPAASTGSAAPAAPAPSFRDSLQEAYVKVRIAAHAAHAADLAANKELLQIKAGELLEGYLKGKFPDAKYRHKVKTAWSKKIAELVLKKTPTTDEELAKLFTLSSTGTSFSSPDFGMDGLVISTYSRNALIGAIKATTDYAAATATHQEKLHSELKLSEAFTDLDKLEKKMAEKKWMDTTTGSPTPVPADENNFLNNFFIDAVREAKEAVSNASKKSSDASAARGSKEHLSTDDMRAAASALDVEEMTRRIAEKQGQYRRLTDVAQQLTASSSWKPAIWGWGTAYTKDETVAYAAAMAHVSVPDAKSPGASAIAAGAVAEIISNRSPKPSLTQAVAAGRAAALAAEAAYKQGLTEFKDDAQRESFILASARKAVNTLLSKAEVTEENALQRASSAQEREAAVTSALQEMKGPPPVAVRPLETSGSDIRDFLKSSVKETKLDSDKLLKEAQKYVKDQGIDTALQEAAQKELAHLEKTSQAAKAQAQATIAKNKGSLITVRNTGSFDEDDVVLSTTAASDIKKLDLDEPIEVVWKEKSFMSSEKFTTKKQECKVNTSTSADGKKSVSLGFKPKNSAEQAEAMLAAFLELHAQHSDKPLEKIFITKWPKGKADSLEKLIAAAEKLGIGLQISSKAQEQYQQDRSIGWSKHFERGLKEAETHLKKLTASNKSVGDAEEKEHKDVKDSISAPRPGGSR